MYVSAIADCKSRWFHELTDAVVVQILDMIDKKTHEIRQDEDKVVYKSLGEIADDLPDNSPRYILLSYPLTLVRLSLRASPWPGPQELDIRGKATHMW
jgi:hypothetical protein